MSKNLSMGQLLPIAIELFKLRPSVTATTKVSDKNAQSEETLKLADEFATFCLRLHQKLNNE